MNARVDERSVVAPFLILLGTGMALIGVGLVLNPPRWRLCPR